MSERFAHLTEEVDRAHSTATSVEDLARSARDALSRRIQGRDFLLDCAERIVNAVAANADLSGSGLVLHANEQLCYRFKVFFWAPGLVNPPHQHNTWGVTGVLHNESIVVLYRRQDGAGQDDGQLVPERQLAAGAGKVGYLVPPCIHSLRNPGDSISITLHLFTDSPDKEQRVTDTVWFPMPGGEMSGVTTETPRYIVLRGTAEMLARIDDPRSLWLLERIFSLGGPRIKLICVKAMVAIDPQRTASRSAEFHASLPGALHEELRAVLTVGGAGT